MSSSISEAILDGICTRLTFARGGAIFARGEPGCLLETPREVTVIVEACLLRDLSQAGISSGYLVTGEFNPKLTHVIAYGATEMLAENSG